jgi:hypothetical protein
MNKNYNSIFRIVAYVSFATLAFFLLKNYLFKVSAATAVENFRSIYILDFWNSINVGFLSSKYFFSFVLLFPLIVSVFYLLLYISLKFFGSDYRNFYYIKEITIFFGFLYFFFFILILIDFVYYIEIHKLYFNITEEEMRLFLRKNN